MAKRSALQKQTYSVVMSEGLAQHFDGYVTAGPKLLVANNIEFDKLGRATKRAGFLNITADEQTEQDPYTASGIAPVRLLSAEDELVAYTGSRVFAYSPTLDTWAMKCEWGSYQAETFSQIIEPSRILKNGDCVVALGMVYASYGLYGLVGEAEITTLYSNVYDETTGGIIYKRKVIDSSNDVSNYGIRVLKCGSSDQYVVTVYRDGNGYLNGAWIYTLVPENDWSSSQLASGVGDFDAVSMGTSGYAVAFYDSAGPTLRVKTFTYDGTEVYAANPALSSAAYQSVALDWDGTYLHVAYRDNTSVLYKKYDAALSLDQSGSVATGLTAATHSRMGIGYDSARDCCLVVYGDIVASTYAGSYNVNFVKWQEIDASDGSQSGVEQTQPYMQLTSRVVSDNGKYFFLLNSETWDATLESPGYLDQPCTGIYGMRVEPETLATAYTYGTLVSIFGKGIGFGMYTNRCVHNLTESSNGGWFTLQNVLGPTGSNDWSTGEYDFQQTIYKLTRDAPGVCKTLVGGSGSMVLGGVPGVYDRGGFYNINSTELPVMIKVSSTTGGSLTSSGTYGVRLAEEWTDDQGRQVYGESSIPYSITLGASDTKIQVVIRMSALENKRDWWPDPTTNFSHRRLAVYRTESGGEVYYYDGFVSFSRYQTDWGLYEITLADTAVENRREAYTQGGELSNTGLPSCHVGCSTGRRFFVRSDEDKRRVYFSKPLTSGRSVEFDVNFSFLDFPENIVSMAAMDGVPVCLGESNAYFVEGLGPGSTGQPANAFAVRTVSGPVSCNDQESALVIPSGVVFRSEMGFYLITRAGQYEYIGGGIEDTAALYPTTLDTLVDEELGVARWLLGDGTNTIIVCFNWLTGQWYTHSYTLGVDGEQFNSMCMHNGEQYLSDDSGGIYQATGWLDVDYSMSLVSTIRFGWENLGDIQSRKRWWEVHLLMRRKDVHGLNVRVYYDRLDTQYDTWTISSADVTTIGEYERVRLQIPHGRQLSDCISVEIYDSGVLVEPDVYSDSQAFEFIGITYVMGVLPGSLKVSQERMM